MISQQRSQNVPSLISYAAPEDAPHKRLMIRTVERLSGQSRIVRIYKQARCSPEVEDDIFALAVRSLRLAVRYDSERLAAVPRQGPLVVVANHPFGVVDGLVLCYLISRVRADFKVVAMSTLCHVPEMRDHVLPINFAPTREAIITSARSRAAARALVRAGGCLIIFPAGAVSTSSRLFGPAEDASWHPFAGKLIQGSEAAVLPVRFEGQNSRLFQLASRVSPTLRLSLLLGEAVGRIGTEIKVHVGDVQPFEFLRQHGDPRTLVDHLRQLTYTIPSYPPHGVVMRPCLSARSQRHVRDQHHLG